MRVDRCCHDSLFRPCTRLDRKCRNNTRLDRKCSMFGVATFIASLISAEVAFSAASALSRLPGST